MKITFIPLAEKKMSQRGIPREWAEETIRKPDQKVDGYGGRVVYQRLYEMGKGKKRLLRVICERRSEGHEVITSYLTSDIQRYWRE